MRLMVFAVLFYLSAAGCGSPSPPSISATATTAKPIVSEATADRVELSLRPPKLGKTATFNVIVDSSDGQWGIRLNQVDTLVSYSTIGSVVIAGPMVEWLIDRHNKSSTTSLTLGTAKWPTVVYAGRVLTSDSLYQDFKRQYGKEFDVQLVKIPVSFFPAKSETDDFSEAIQAIEVNIQFNEAEQGQPVVLDVFPKTSFEDEGWKISGAVGIGPSGLIRSGLASVEAKADIGISFEYSPLIAKVISDGVGNEASWRIKAVKDRQPVGQIDYYCTVLIPRKLKTTDASLDIKLWFDEGDERYIEIKDQPMLIDFGRDSD